MSIREEVEFYLKKNPNATDVEISKALKIKRGIVTILMNRIKKAQLG